MARAFFSLLIDAPVSHWRFKLLAIIQALRVLPRRFCHVQSFLWRSKLYRHRWLLFLNMPHIRRARLNRL